MFGFFVSACAGVAVVPALLHEAAKTSVELKFDASAPRDALDRVIREIRTDPFDQELLRVHGTIRTGANAYIIFPGHDRSYDRERCRAAVQSAVSRLIQRGEFAPGAVEVGSLQFERSNSVRFEAGPFQFKHSNR